LTNGHFAYRERKTALVARQDSGVGWLLLRTCQKNSQGARERLTDAGEHQRKAEVPFTKSAKNGV
jgi:hypothetical protein